MTKHSKSHGHSRNSEALEHLGDGPLVAAALINLLLTAAEIAGGVIGGSLALVADALHNLNDCASLVVALVARRIARRRADRRRTFGYRRAEVIGSLVNLTALLVVSVLLVAEGIRRLLEPEPIAGGVVLAVAVIALVVDLATVGLLYALSGRGLNIRAALLHNLADAMASVGVIVVAVAVMLWNLRVLDPIITMLIAGYVLWQSLPVMGRSVAILMESVPEDVDIDELTDALLGCPGVRGVHHLHVWELDEEHRAMEAHVVINFRDADRIEQIKHAVKTRLRARFRIVHSTLEFEFPGEGDASDHDLSVIPG
jgi:cobalt-zinc-cadmium efflux system protein